MSDGRDGSRMAWPDAGVIHLHWLDRQRQDKRRPLANVLARYLGVAPHELGIIEDETSGKPRLAEVAQLRFNWSHTDNVALLAVANAVEVGVDLERSDRALDAMALAKRFFSAAEHAWLESLPQGKRGAGFLRLWTGKEAVLKATGTGISAGLDRVTFLPTGAYGLVLDRQRLGRGAAHVIQVRALATLEPGQLAALAWLGPSEVRVYHFHHLARIADHDLHAPAADERLTS